MIPIHAFTHVLRQTRHRSPTFALLAVLAVAGCDNNDPVATSAPSDIPATIATTDSVTATDTTTDAATDAVMAPDAPAFLTATRPGVAYGPFALWNTSTTTSWGPAPFTSSINATDAGGIVRQISAARSKGQRLVLVMTGGGHSQYKTNGKFDLAKWKMKMNTFKTSTIKSAVAAGVADGTIIGNSVMDEPEVPDWGGVPTKWLIDQMGAYVKAIFPTLPVGVVHGPYGYARWRSWERYRVLDFVYNQYNWSVNSGNVTLWRDQALAQARLDGVKIAFGVNLLDGGTRISGCPIPQTGGRGTYSINCRMTPTQVRSWGLTLGPSGCAFLMWRYDWTFFSKSANVQAFKDVAVKLASLSSRNCRRA